MKTHVDYFRLNGIQVKAQGMEIFYPIAYVNSRLSTQEIVKQ